MSGAHRASSSVSATNMGNVVVDIVVDSIVIVHHYIVVQLRSRASETLAFMLVAVVAIVHILLRHVATRHIHWIDVRLTMKSSSWFSTTSSGRQSTKGKKLTISRKRNIIRANEVNNILHSIIQSNKLHTWRIRFNKRSKSIVIT